MSDDYDLRYISGPLGTVDTHVQNAIDALADLGRNHKRFAKMAVNSAGGSVFDSFRLANAIADSPVEVQCEISTMAYGTGFLVARACNHVKALKCSLIGVGRCSIYIPPEDDLTVSMRNMIDSIDKSICDFICDRLPTESARYEFTYGFSRVGGVYWNGEQAAELGLIDEVV